jgi:hypothetical protein
MRDERIAAPLEILVLVEACASRTEHDDGSTGCAFRRVRAAEATACSSVPEISKGTAWPSVAAKAGAASPIR